MENDRDTSLQSREFLTLFLPRSTPLHVAASKGYLDLAKFLAVEGRGDLEAKTSDDGLTPLLLAASNGHAKVLAALADAGARLDARDARGRGAGTLAQGNPKVLKALERAAKDADVQLADDAPPASCARCAVAVPKPKRCGRCKKVVYCSQACQVKHWPAHKSSCGVVLAKAPPPKPKDPDYESESEEEDTRPRDLYGEIDRRPPEDTMRMVGV